MASLSYEPGSPIRIKFYNQYLYGILLSIDKKIGYGKFVYLIPYSCKGEIKYYPQEMTIRQRDIESLSRE